MKTRLILKPGRPGTKSLVKKYGDALLCVRFRYDAESRQRLKTVELIVERAKWTPPVETLKLRNSPARLWKIIYIICRWAVPFH